MFQSKPPLSSAGYGRYDQVKHSTPLPISQQRKAGPVIVNVTKPTPERHSNRRTLHWHRSLLGLGSPDKINTKQEAPAWNENLVNPAWLIIYLISIYLMIYVNICIFSFPAVLRQLYRSYFVISTSDMLLPTFYNCLTLHSIHCFMDNLSSIVL